MPLHHVTISERWRHPLASTEDERRRVVRAVASTARQRLIGFGLAEEHLHSLVLCERPRLLARDLCKVLLGLCPDRELKAPHIDPILSRWHGTNVLRYLLAQPTHHRMEVAPATFAGSCFPDLVGARLLPFFERTRLRSHLPGFRLRSVFPVVGLEPVPIVESSDEVLRWVGVGRLVKLVAGVFALPGDLVGRSALHTQGRAVAASLAERLGERLSDLADVLRISRQAVWQLARRPVAPPVLRAVRLRHGLEELEADCRLKGLRAIG